jgi:mRNA-degrading endonuclease RelE of RelBE toxin-antitoxin system
VCAPSSWRPATSDLAAWPDCRNVKALVGREGYRLRVGRYRVLFTINAHHEPVIVQIEEVKKRDERTY